jgi:hypothetical protein
MLTSRRLKDVADKNVINLNATNATASTQLPSRESSGMIPRLRTVAMGPTYGVVVIKKVPCLIPASVFCFFFGGQFCVANNPQEDSAKFGYKLNMKVIFLDILLYFWLPVLKPCIQNLRIFLQFCSNYGY